MGRLVSKKEKQAIVKHVVDSRLPDGVHVIIVGGSNYTVKVENPLITITRTGSRLTIPEEYRI
ncbi:MAG: hypothetical protein EHM49_00205 [Deltaproteobacteria bacterium]|nr:MAG: hypothetical protein EHM49_00205 [Deltaproteobacteria bacterium]